MPLTVFTVDICVDSGFAVSLVAFVFASCVVIPVEGQPVVLTFTQQAGVKAFLAICPHLGCVSQWEQSGGFILCPCHDGRFNAQTGAVISGPPPSGLPPKDTVIDGDDVYVVV